jgi:hypothetical protein
MPSNMPCPPGCACKRHSRSTYGGKPLQTREEKLATARRWRAANRERLAEQQRDRYAANIERVREQKRRYKDANRDRVREVARQKRPQYALKAYYGLSLEQWAQMFEEQEGLCYLCSEPLDLESKRKIHVDHDHDCCRGGKSCGSCVRGLACNECNLGIGRFGDDPDRMERAAARLRAAKAAVVARKAAGLVQEELPLNVSPIRREVAG